VRFLVDAQLPPALCDWLGARGHIAVHVTTLGLLAAADDIIAHTAEQGDYVLISKDEDFIRLRLPNRFGLLWLRIGNATNRALVTWLEARWAVTEHALLAGERLIELR
jgi:predicted nuclease of predicted toxin-antitoxin system